MTFLTSRPSVAGLLARARSLYHSLRHRDAVAAEMNEEFRLHVELRAEDLRRSGYPPDEAERRARIEFGHMDSHRADARVARGLRLFDEARVSWIDVKLGLRMLRKHPVLSLAAVFALAVGIPIGLAPGHAARALEAPLPGDPEHRVRAIRLWDPVTSSVAATTDGDFERWSRELESFSRLAVFSTTAYNVALGDGGAAPVAGALVSPATFAIVSGTPQLGRTFVDADGERGAPAVAVLGHDLWTARFGADPGIVGRSIRVGRVTHTVVGVMPEGFRFPANEQLWLPLPPTLAERAGDERSVRIVGRLADGVSPEQAQAELDAMARLDRPEIPAARARLLPEVVPFGLQYLGLPRGGLDALPEFRFVQLLALALLLVACGNVAMLVYARTATRAREMAMRTALGASRSRIVTQVFVETIVLATVAAASGVLAIDWLLGHVNLAAIAGESALPYWLSLGITGPTMLQAVALAVLSATVAGVAPAIRITGRWVQQSLRGPARTRFGGWINALVIADIAVAVAVVGLALAMGKHANVLMASDRATGVRAAEVLAMELRLPDGAGGATRVSDAERAAATQRALVAALEREPGIRSIAIAEALPRMEHRMRPLEVEGVELPPDTPPRWVRSVRVDAGYLAGLGQRVLSGRDFTAADADGTRDVVIVNTAFASRLLGGGEAIGRRVRVAPATGAGDTAWHRIIGVVGHLGVNMMNPEHGEAVYFPAAPGQLPTLQVGIRTAGNPALLIPRVREIATAVDPELIVGRSVVLSDVRQGDWYLTIAITGGLGVLVVVLVVLATSGLYAMLSLSVSERTREIGIRSALGGQRGTLVLTVLRRSLMQIGVGALVGLPVAFRFVSELADGGEGTTTLLDAALIALAMATSIVAVVGLLACLVPARRVLAIEATQAMKGEG
jgi:predicted permease